MPDPVIPAVKEEKSGLELLKAATRGEIDYSEDFTPEPKTPAPVVPAPVAVTPATPTIDPIAEKALQEAQIRETLARNEAIRAQAERDLLLRQAEEAKVTPATPEPDLAELYATDPLAAMKKVAEDTAKRVREETLAEVNAQNQNQAMLDNLEARKATYAKNQQEVWAKHPELKDPNHEFTKVVIEVEKELPFLFTIPEGPLKTLEIASQRYELAQLKKAPVTPATPEALAEAEKKGKEAEAARAQAASTAAIISGPSRGVAPTSVSKLSAEQEYAARKLRMTPEAYSASITNNSKNFRKEEAPRRSK